MSNKEPLVAIIILNWNGANDTIACVESLQKLSYQNKRIVIVDNASTGDDLARFRTTFSSDISICENKKNEGFAQGNNSGMRWAQDKYSPDFYWLINNDTEVDPQALTELLKAYSNYKDNTIIGSQIRYWESSKIYCLGGGKINLWTGIDKLWGAKIDHHDSYIPDYFSYISGCSLFFSQSVLNRIKGFDPDYFLYNEDADLGMRSKQNGVFLEYSPASIVYHKSSQSSGYHSTKYIYYFLRNKLIFMKKNARWWHWFTFLPVFTFYYCGGFTWLYWRKNKQLPIRIICKSVKDFIAGRWRDQVI